MKNKNLHLATLGFYLFGEKFLTFVQPREAASEQSAEAAELNRKVSLLFDKVNAALKPATNLTWAPKSNPYADDLTAFVKDLPDLSNVNFDANPVKKDGKLVLKYDGGKKEVVFEGPTYRALFWTEISKQLQDLFKGKNVTNELLMIGVANESSAPKLNELIEQIVKDPSKVSAILTKEALDELDELRARLAAGTAQDREAMRVGLESQARRDSVALDVERNKMQLPAHSSIPNHKFIEMSEKESDRFNEGFDPWKLNIKLEGLQIDAHQWSTLSDAALNKVYVEWRALGIPVTEPFYQKLFVILRDANNPQKNKLLSNPDYANWFKDPENNLNNIANITDDVGEDGQGFPQAFVKAYSHFSYIKIKILSLSSTQTASLEAQRNLDGHALIDKPMDFLRANYAKFTQAIKDHDWATAGLYCLGIYAMYKSYKSLSQENQDSVKKWLFYGVAGYCGYVFAKNAGYDILKMAGLRDDDAEVRGTPMEAIAAMNLPEAEDLDYDIVLRMSEVKIGDLNDLFKEANRNGQNFIHPKQFPQIFPDLARIGYFPMGIGEQGLADNTGNMNKKLTPKQREYIRVGQQLYKLMLVLRAAYGKTLEKEEGKTFEKAMEDKVLRESKIRHFCAVFGLYAFPTYEAGIMFNRTLEKAKEQLAVAFDAYGDSKIGFSLSEAEKDVSKKPGIYKGAVMGFPVYFVYSVKDKNFKVYLANDFGGEDVPGKKYIAEIPLEGAPKQKAEVGKVVTAVTNRMDYLLRLVKTNTEKPKFDGDSWTAKVKVPGNPEFDIAESETLATIIPRDDGNGLTITMENGSVPFDLDAHNAERIPLSITLLQGLFRNPDTEALKPFNNANRLAVNDPVPGDQKFNITVANLAPSLEISYDKLTKKFTIVGGEEALVMNKEFGDAYVDALDADPNFALTNLINDLEKTMTVNCPTSVLSHVWDMITGGLPSGPVSISGVPANYARMVLQNAKQTLLARLQKSLEGKKSLKDVEYQRKFILEDGYNRLSNVLQSINDKNSQLANSGEGWNQDEFMRMLDMVRLSSTISSAYAYAQTEMEQAIYKLDLPGVNCLDVSKGAHLSAAKLMKVFAYHTSHLDNAEHTFYWPNLAAPGQKVSKTSPVSLDNLVYPPAPTPGFNEPAEDPALRGHMILNYFNYVKGKILEGANALPSLEAVYIPSPTSSKWSGGIKDFDNWAKTEGSYQALDPLDNKKAYEHDLALHDKEEFTELDNALMDEMERSVDYQNRELGPNVLNMAAIDYYFESLDANDLGLFVTISDGQGGFKCKLWDKTNRIATQANGRRSIQTQLIQKETENFMLEVIFKEKDGQGKLKFFIEQPGYWEKTKACVLKKWPGVYQTLLNWGIF